MSKYVYLGLIKDDDDGDEKVFYPFSWAADPSSAAVIDLLPGFNMSHEIIMMIITMSHDHDDLV